MKLIHCADLHLDAKMTSTLDKERAKERKAELLQTFCRMIDYAKKNQISHILICGDLFDAGRISAAAGNVVRDTIRNNPEITYYYLKGNHDMDGFLSEMDEIPDNLKVFGEQWVTYDIPGEASDSSEKNYQVSVSGIELSKENSQSAYNTLVLDRAKINIVMLHGQEAETGAKDKTEIIRLRELHNKGIDYLALGHIHGYKKEKLDGRGIYCYSGCLEGRGFDECGDHGFVVLDIDEKSGEIKDTFVSFAARRLYTVKVDASGCMSSVEICEKIKEELAKANCTRADLIKFVLTGSVDVQCEINLPYLQSAFATDYYFVKVYDETVFAIDIMDYQYDETLKGEFIRTVMADDTISSEEKTTIIHLGLKVLANEEVVS